VWDEKKRAKKIRYFFLFNDILLLCKKESSKRYWLRIHITLRSPSVSIEEIGNSSYNHEFRLHCRSRSFMLYAPTSDAKEDWITDLKRSIGGDFPNEQKDKQLQKQGQDLVRKRDDSEPVKKVGRRKKGEEAEEKSEGSESNGEAEGQEEEAPKSERKKRKPKKDKKADPTNTLLLDLLGPSTVPSMPLTMGTTGMGGPGGNPFLAPSASNPFGAPTSGIYLSGSGVSDGLRVGTGGTYSSNPGAGYSSSPFGSTGGAFGGGGLGGSAPNTFGSTGGNPFVASGTTPATSFGAPTANPFMSGNPNMGGGLGGSGLGGSGTGYGQPNNSISVFGSTGGTGSFGASTAPFGVSATPSFGAQSANPFGGPAASAASNPFLNPNPSGGFF